VNTDEASNLIAAAALAVAILSGIWAEVVRRSSAMQAKRADHAAERSAAALEQMARQFGDSLSRQEKRDQWSFSGRSSADQLPDSWIGRGPWAGPVPGQLREPAVHWSVDRLQGRKHMLRNLGQITAYDVVLRSENAVRFDGPEPQDMPMGATVEFLAIGSMQTGTPELVVSWRDAPDGDRREWRRILP
jgi:hypothetical protein